MARSRLTSYGAVAAMTALAELVIPARVRAQDASQRKPIELGMDASLARAKNDQQTSTNFTLPVSQFRVGFFLSDAVSLEPIVAFRYTRASSENQFGTTSKFNGTSYDFSVARSVVLHALVMGGSSEL